VPFLYDSRARRPRPRKALKKYFHDYQKKCFPTFIIPCYEIFFSLTPQLYKLTSIITAAFRTKCAVIMELSLLENILSIASYLLFEYKCVFYIVT